jgi:predicted small integral membrane protein
MWQSEDWNGLDAALRVFVFSGVVLLVDHLPGTSAGTRDAL